MRYKVVTIPKDEVKVSLWNKLNVSTEFETDSFAVAQQMLAIIADIYQVPQLEWSDVPTELSIETEDLILKIVEVQDGQQ
jgi:hypothetical protein